MLITLEKFYKKHPLVLVVIIATVTYFSFYYKLLSPTYFFGGSDAKHKHIPARVYLYRSIVIDHKFPFWTEKQYSGFPIYADPENGYLNPINVVSILAFGPILSYKLIHYFFYLLGSVSLYLLLKRFKLGFTSYIISNLIYFFSFFMLNHNIHFNIITVVFLFPLNLLLADNFIKRKEIKYVIFQALVLSLGVLWGQIQMSFLVCVGIFMYLLILGYKKINFKTFIFYNLLLSFLVVILTLPQIVPAYMLYKNSYRIDNLSYEKGTLTPPLLGVLAYPYVFGRNNASFAENFKYSLSYTEVTIYASICALILAFLNILFMKMSRLKLLLFINIFIFAIFACAAYIPIKSSWLPVLSLFRYWIRSVFLASFSIGILAGFFIEKFQNNFNIKNFKKNLIYPLSIILYLLISFFLNINNYDPEFEMPYPWRRLLVHDTKVWLLIVFSIFLMLILFFILKYFKKKIPHYLYTVSFIFLVFFDLLFFSQDILNYRIRNISDYIKKGNVRYKNVRIAEQHNPDYGEEYLYYESWSPFGYSQFINNEYRNYMKSVKLSLANYGGSHAFVEDLQGLGVRTLINLDNHVITNNTVKDIDLISNTVNGNYIKKIEGNIKIKLENPKDQIIKTYIRSDNDWVLLVDNKKRTINNSNVFLSFNLEKGEHVVELKYIPYTFYRFLFVSISIITILFFIYTLYKKSIYVYFLK